MIVTYVRSSSIGTFNQCAHKFWMVYNLGLKDPSNKAAMKGVIFHKVMEVYAQIGMAQKKGKKTLTDEAFGRIKCDITQEQLIDLSWNYYTEKSEKKFYPADKRDIAEWIDIAMTLDDGAYDPRNMQVEAHELYFDIEVPHEWAKYRYKIDDKWVEGQLRIKGTIDLVIRNDGMLEIMDWKTGQRKDWATGEPKTYAKLSVDHQLLLYYYVVRTLYQEPVAVTIVYVRAGGAFTFNFTDEDYLKAEEIIRENFENIRKCYEPKPIYPAELCRYCSFNHQKIGEKTACKHYYDELVQIGMGPSLSGSSDHLFKYQDGGGRSA